MDKEKALLRALKGLSWLTQLGFSLVCPPLLCVFAAIKLQARFQLGAWVLITAVIVGVLSSVCTFISFAKQMLAQAKENDEEKEVDDNET